MNRIFYETWFYQNLDIVMNSWFKEKRLDPPIDENFENLRHLVAANEQRLRDLLGENQEALDFYLRLLDRQYTEEGKRIFVRGMKLASRFLVKTLFDEGEVPPFVKGDLQNEDKTKEDAPK